GGGDRGVGEVEAARPGAGGATAGTAAGTDRAGEDGGGHPGARGGVGGRRRERRRERPARATTTAATRAPEAPAAARTRGWVTPVRRRPMATRTRSRVPSAGSTSRLAMTARGWPGGRGAGG